MMKWDLFQGCKDISISKISNKVEHHINELKNKSNMTISVDAENAFNKFNIHLWLKCSSKEV